MLCKIGVDGLLSVYRAGEYKRQSCPFTPGDVKCGDHCPLFNEGLAKTAPEDSGTPVIVLSCAPSQTMHHMVEDSRLVKMAPKLIVPGGK